MTVSGSDSGRTGAPCAVLAVQPESDQDVVAAEQLFSRIFGPGRFARSSFRLREQARHACSCPHALPSADPLALSLKHGDRLAGSVRLTPLLIGGRAGATLLGPLVVDSDYSGQGCGRRLMLAAEDLARAQPFELIVLVGDLSFYERFGYVPVPVGRLQWPGPVDPARILVRELQPGSLQRFSGAVIGHTNRPVNRS